MFPGFAGVREDLNQPRSHPRFADMTSKVPSDAPPSYEKATSHPTKNGISPQARRSMEDEQRALPQGWVRQYDQETHHQFFVDTTKNPPRSIWHHPYDDEEYISSLSPEERSHLTRMNRSVSLKDIEAESSDDEAGPSSGPHAKAVASASSSSAQPSGVHKWGRKLKDKITSSTHEDRERDRQERARQEQRAYENHLAARRALSKAIETGQPQLLGKDRDGRDVYIEPPSGPGAGQYGSNGYGYNPYAQGPYGAPPGRYMRPGYGYSRPYGYGYGGGYGLPIAGGLLGGALLGAALF